MSIVEARDIKYSFKLLRMMNVVLQEILCSTKFCYAKSLLCNQEQERSTMIGGDENVAGWESE